MRAAATLKNAAVNFRSHLSKSLEEAAEAVGDRRLTEIGDALDELASAEPALAHIVDLKFSCGFTFAEIAAMNGVSERTVQRQWEKARIYLRHSMQTTLEI
jgi:DNA-directed RNA polymerase specialized sigma24 family protein